MSNKHYKIHKPGVKKVREEIYDPKLELDDFNIKLLPKFHTAEECKYFLQNFPDASSKLIDYKIITDFEKLKEIIFNGIDDKEHQFDTDLNTEIRNNLPKEFAPVLNIVDKKRDIYKGDFKERLLNTLTYLFYHMRSGIYCRIEDNKVKQFIIFVNKDYINNWSQYITFADEDGNLVSMEEYYRIKRKYYRKENILPIERWWGGPYMVDNEPSPNLFGYHLVSSITDMLYYTCQVTKLKNTSFFINKRDHPQLRADLTEAYSFLFPKETKLSKEYLKKGFIPIHSWFTSEYFADIPSVSTDDYDTITGLIPLSDRPSDKYSNINYEKYKNIKWKDKKNILFFRGSGTGSVDLETNQRFKLAKISYEYNNNSVEPKKDSVLNAGVISYNVRDKKISSESPIRFTPRDKLGIPLANFVPMSEQMKMRMIADVPGQSSAARYLFLMKMKVVIFKVESNRPMTANLWFTPMLEPGVDHIKINADYSNLFEMINWCINNENQCKKIAKTAYKKYRTLFTKTNVLNYYAYCINSF